MLAGLRRGAHGRTQSATARRRGRSPPQPGVYRFRDAAGRVLYVGKAKNLRARLSNYFAPLRTLHERTRRMVTTASSVEWTVVGTEFEALQLEFTWIKEFDPPFNVQFRDDKSYPYLAITLGRRRAARAHHPQPQASRARATSARTRRCGRSGKRST